MLASEPGASRRGWSAGMSRRCPGIARVLPSESGFLLFANHLDGARGSRYHGRREITANQKPSQESQLRRTKHDQICRPFARLFQNLCARMAQSDLALSLHTVGLQRLDHEFNQSPSAPPSSRRSRQSALRTISIGGGGGGRRCRGTTARTSTFASRGHALC
jgi:hypothetical protein